MENNNQLQQSKDKVDLCLKIGILIVLIIGVTLLSKGGFQCQADPFVYGAGRMVEKETNQGHMDCLCSIYDNYNTKNYAFNEKEENPYYLTNQDQPTMLIESNIGSDISDPDFLDKLMED